MKCQHLYTSLYRIISSYITRRICALPIYFLSAEQKLQAHIILETVYMQQIIEEMNDCRAHQAERECVRSFFNVGKVVKNIIFDLGGKCDNAKFALEMRFTVIYGPCTNFSIHVQYLSKET